MHFEGKSGQPRHADSQSRAVDLHYFESMDRINRAMQGATDLDHLMREVFEALRPAAGSVPRPDIGALPRIRGDGVMLRHAFANLPSNAIKFSRPKQAPLIEIGGSISGGQAVYFVRGNGVGFTMHTEWPNSKAPGSASLSSSVSSTATAGASGPKRKSAQG